MRYKHRRTHTHGHTQEPAQQPTALERDLIPAVENKRTTACDDLIPHASVGVTVMCGDEQHNEGEQSGHRPSTPSVPFCSHTNTLVLAILSAVVFCALQESIELSLRAADLTRALPA